MRASADAVPARRHAVRRDNAVFQRPCDHHGKNSHIGAEAVHNVVFFIKPQRLLRLLYLAHLLAKQRHISKRHGQNQRKLGRKRTKQIEQTVAGHDLRKRAEPEQHRNHHARRSSAVEQRLQRDGIVVHHKQHRSAIVIGERIDQRHHQIQKHNPPQPLHSPEAVSQKEIRKRTRERNHQDERIHAYHRHACSAEQR